MTKRTMGIGAVVILALSMAGMSSVAAKTKSGLSELDANALQMAEDACRNEEFTSLLQAMAISDAVLLKYSAPTISIVRDGDATSVSSGDYDDFPVGMLDYYWISRASMLAWEDNPDAEIEHLEMEFNQSQSNQWAVDWQQVRYDGNSSGGDDLGEVVERIGQPGVLLFELTRDCWELVEDYRGQG